jgi:predicted metal-binding protein
MDKMFEKYIDLAKQAGILNALIISPNDIVFDIRANLKCGWGCDRGITTSIKCDNRGTSYQERVQMVKQYNKIFLLHSNNPQQLSKVILKLEKSFFLDGYYFTMALRACNLCKECQAQKGKECLHPDQVRPCETMFGIDVYKTVRQLGLPCEVLRNKNDTQNRYGFLLID